MCVHLKCIQDKINQIRLVNECNALRDAPVGMAGLESEEDNNYLLFEYVDIYFVICCPRLQGRSQPQTTPASMAITRK